MSWKNYPVVYTGKVEKGAFTIHKFSRKTYFIRTPWGTNHPSCKKDSLIRKVRLFYGEDHANKLNEVI